MKAPESVEPPGADQQGVRSVQRALDILTLLTAERPTVTVREIVDATGLAKTTVIRLVSTLEQSGLLWATTSGYMAGPGLWRWAHLAQRSWELPPETQRLTNAMGRATRYRAIDTLPLKSLPIATASLDCGPCPWSIVLTRMV